LWNIAERPRNLAGRADHSWKADGVRITRFTRFGGLLAGTAVLAAGCGTVHASGDGTPSSLTAAARGTAAETARIAETTTMRLGGMTVSYTATGEFDFAHARGTLSMSAPVGMTMLFLPPKIYLKLPDGTGSSLPKGKTWMALDANGIGEAAAVPGLGTFGATSPADLLTSLTAISGSVKKLGTGSVRGVAVTEYQVTINPRQAARAAKLPADQRAGYQQFVASLGGNAITADVWVDTANLVRRVTLSMRLPPAMATGTGSNPGKNTRMTETTDFYDFGIQVHLSAPPAAQVASMGSIIAGTGSVSSGGGDNGGGYVNVGVGVNVPSSTPPAASGTLTPAQAMAAEQAVTAFFTALGHHSTAAVAQTVLPAQQSCVTSKLSGAPRITVKSLRIVSAAPAGTGKATVRFAVSVSANLGGQTVPFPVFAPGSGDQHWLATAESGGRWYVDLGASSAFLFSGPC
jgi:hypothetical protein